MNIGECVHTDNIECRAPAWTCTRCGSRTKNCSRTKSGLVICRHPDRPSRRGRVVNGHVYLGPTDDGEWGLFRAVGDRPPRRRHTNPSPDRPENGEPSPVAKPKPVELTEPQAVFRDRVYRGLIDLSDLSSRHLTNLMQARGMTKDEVKARGYRSVPKFGARCDTARTLRDEFGEAVFDVPGIWLLESKKKPGTTYPLVYPRGGRRSVTGIIVPVVDRVGRVIALRVRVDPDWEDEGKCRWFRKMADARPATFVHYAWPWNAVREPDRCVPEVIVTEGELKAGFTAFRTGLLTLSIPGVGSWKKIGPELAYLKTRGLHTVLLTLDQDEKPNPHVYGAAKNLYDLASGLGLGVRVVRWGDRRDG